MLLTRNISLKINHFKKMSKTHIVIKNHTNTIFHYNLFGNNYSKFDIS